MPTTIKRQKIRDAIKTRLQGITVAGGYYTNLGTKVTVWKTNPFAANKVDAIDIRDDPEEQEVDAEDESLENRKLHVALKLIFKAPTPSEIVVQGITDVEKAIKVDETWSGLAYRTIPDGNTMDVKQDEVTLGGATVNIIIEYQTEKFTES